MNKRLKRWKAWILSSLMVVTVMIQPIYSIAADSGNMGNDSGRYTEEYDNTLEEEETELKLETESESYSEEESSEAESTAAAEESSEAESTAAAEESSEAESTAAAEESSEIESTAAAEESSEIESTAAAEESSEAESTELENFLPVLPNLTVSDETYEAFDAARTTQDGIFDFRIRPLGSSEEGVAAYCFNYHLLNPDMIQMGVVSPYYRIEDTSNRTFAHYAQHERDASTLKQDVLNVVWNGYPYYGGEWKGVSVGNPYEKMLLDIYYTQVAVWYYSDSLDTSDMSLIQSARENPAPANFVLDLYDGTKATGAGLELNPEYEHYQNLLAVRAESFDPGDDHSKISITINKIWEVLGGEPYEGEKPDVSFELYEGSREEGEEPIQIIELPKNEQSVTFTMLDDDKTYTLHEVMTGYTEGFLAAEDQTILLGEIAEETYSVDFTNTYVPEKKDGSLKITKTVLEDDADSQQAFDFLVKLENQDGGAYDKEYTITIGEEVKTIPYDPNTGILFSLKNGETCEISALPEGVTFTVEEINISEEYILDEVKMDSVSLEDVTVAEGEIRGDQVALVEFVNRKLPKPVTVPLIIEKTVKDAPAGTENMTFDFNLKLFQMDETTPYEGNYTLNGSSKELPYDADKGISLQIKNGETAMIGGLTENLYYEIEEAEYPDYHPDEKVKKGHLTQPGVWIEYINQYIDMSERKLTLKKEVDGDSRGESFSFDVTLEGEHVRYSPQSLVEKVAENTYRVTLKDGEEVTFYGMSEGYSYFIREEETKYEDILVTQTNITAPAKALISGKTVTDTNVTDTQTDIIYTNQVVSTVDLSLTKQVIKGNEADRDKYDFEMKLWKNGVPMKEDDTVSVIRRNSEGVEDADTILFDDQGIARFQLMDGESIILENLPTGEYTYECMEINADDYDTFIDAPDFVEVNEEKKQVSQAENNPLSQTTEIVFTNSKKEIEEPETGHLTISKIVAGEGDISRLWNFSVVLSDTSISGVYGDLQFENGVAQFTLKHGETKEALGLPADISYRVEEKEANQDMYTTTSMNSIGTIFKNKTAVVSFVNYKDPDCPGQDDPSPAKVYLSAEKLLDGKAPVDDRFTFLLKDEWGNVLQIKKNDGSNVVFDELTFTEEGTYHFTVTEETGNEERIQYDKTVYSIDVVVRKAEDFWADVTYRKDGKRYCGDLIFINTTQPEPEKDETYLTVHKEWNLREEGICPPPVSVQLYRDGVAFGEAVLLNAENGWKYTWDHLDKNHVWSVDEESVPEGYIKIVSHCNQVWTITNVQMNIPVEPEDPNEDQKPPLDPGKEEDNKDPSGPQTGDPFHMIGFGLLAVVSLFAVVFVAGKSYRTKKK